MTTFALVHGAWHGAWCWKRLAGELERRGHGVVAVDLPCDDPDATFAGYAAVVVDALGDTGDDVVLVGHSLGGFAAMAYAAGRPDSLAGLVLAGSSATPTGPGAAVYRGVAALTNRLGPARMTRINDRVLHRLYPAERIDPVIAGGYWFAPTPAAWREVMTHCRPSMLQGVRCPVLLLNGQFDQFRLGERSFLRACPTARVEIIRRASHLSNLDQPKAFADALLRFAGEVADSAHRA